jgi:transposase/very-short-patch-repair endonuclease
MDVKVLENKEWLYDTYINQGKSVRGIATMLSVGDGRVVRWLDIHGIKRRNIQESRISSEADNNKINDGTTIPFMYKQGMNIKQIAKELNCGIQTVYRRLKKYNIKIENFEHRALKRNPLLRKLRNKVWLHKKYIINNLSVVDIAKELKTDAGLVYTWLKFHKIEIKDSSFSHSKEKYSDEDLEKMLRGLADKLGHIPSTRELNEYCSKGLCPCAATYSLRGGIPYWQKRVFGKRNRAWLEWQKKCLSVFNKVLDYPKFKAEKSFDWLRSPITGHKLKVDVYYPELKLCVEFDGLGHFKPVQFLKGQDADKQFEKTRIHDAEKNKRIPEHGLTLIRFRYNEPLTEEYIINLLEEVLRQVA